MNTAPDLAAMPTTITATDPTNAAAAPRIKLLSHGFAIDHPDPEIGDRLMADALGVADREGMHGMIRQLVKASVSGESPDEVNLSFMISMVQGIKPRDSVEAMLVGGLGHFLQHRQMLDRMSESPWVETIHRIGDPSILLWLSGFVFILAGFALAAGWMTRITAAALFITLIPVTITMHIAPGHAGPLFKTIAILGALVHFFFNGSGPLSIDRLIRNDCLSG